MIQQEGSKDQRGTAGRAIAGMGSGSVIPPTKKLQPVSPTGGKQAEKNRSKALIVRQSAARYSQLSEVLILDGDAVSKTRNLYPQIVIQRYFFT